MAIPFIARLLTSCREDPHTVEPLLEILTILAIDQDDCCLGAQGVRWSSIFDEECYTLVAGEARRFIPFIGHEELSVSLQACRAVAWFPEIAKQARSPLRDLVHHGRADEQIAALVALGLLGTPVPPILDQTKRMRFASTTAHCHVHPGTKEHLAVFLEMASLRLEDPEERTYIQNSPHGFSLLWFAAEVLHRQPSELLQEFIRRAPDGPLLDTVRLSQHWR